jgi:hypothetical protein
MAALAAIPRRLAGLYQWVTGWLIRGEWHLREALAEYARHYNRHQLNQGLRHGPPLNRPGRVVDVIARIERGKVLGGLISEYHRAALAREKLRVSSYRRILAPDKSNTPDLSARSGAARDD